MSIGAMQFSVGTLLAGFVFGVFGFSILKEGKRAANLRRVMIGIVLIAFGFFVTNPWAAWGIGIVLLWINYFSAWAKGG
jgi:hypothetical protein